MKESPEGRAKRKRAPKSTPHDLESVKKRLQAHKLEVWWEIDAPLKQGSRESWVQIFARDGFQCIYCGTRLNESAAKLAVSTRDHIVPKAMVLVPKGDLHPLNNPGNLGACCGNCNSLKGDNVPGNDSPAWDSRGKFISWIRKTIQLEANQAYAKYSEYVGIGTERLKELLRHEKMTDAQKTRTEQLRKDLEGQLVECKRPAGVLVA